MYILGYRPCESILGSYRPRYFIGLSSPLFYRLMEFQSQLTWCRPFGILDLFLAS
jgi:hypothetical protein